MSNKEFLCTLLYTFIACQCAITVLAAPFNPVTALEGKEVAGVNPVVKIGDPYKIADISYTPGEDDKYHEVGIASWYGDDFHGKLTANGEVFDMNNLTAGHPTLPLPSFVEVTNLENDRKIILRVNDRGPFVSGRVIDISKRAAELLGFEKNGTAHVKVKVLPKISKEAVNELNRINMLKHSTRKDTNKHHITEVSTSISGKDNSSILDVENLAKKDTSKVYIKNISLEEPDNIKSYIPRGVFVQVGAFSHNNSQIKSHIASLSEVGVVTIHKIDIDGNDILRVRVGPYGSIEDAIKIKEKLTSLGYSLSRVVVEQ